MTIKGRELFVLEIEEAYLKLIKVSHEGNRVVIKGFWSTVIKDISEDEAMGINLVSLIKEAGVAGYECYVSLPQRSALCRKIELPLLSEEMLKNAAEYEIARLIPVPLSELFYNAVFVKNSMYIGNVVAIRKEIIESYSSILSSLNVKILGYTVSGYAMTALLKKIIGAKGAFFAIRILGDEAFLIACKNGNLTQMRCIPFTGTESLIDEVEVFIGNIHETGVKSIKMILCVDDTLVQNELKEKLQANNGYSISLWTDLSLGWLRWGNIQELELQKQAYSVIGTLVPIIFNPRDMLDLASSKCLIQINTKLLNPKGLFIASISMFILGYLFNILSVHRNMVNTKQELVKLQPVVSRVADIQEQTYELQDKIKKLESISEDRYSTLEVLKAISIAAKDKAKLDFVNIEGDTVILKGRSVSALQFSSELANNDMTKKLKLGSPISTEHTSTGIMERFDFNATMIEDKYE